MLNCTMVRDAFAVKLSLTFSPSVHHKSFASPATPPKESVKSCFQCKQDLESFVVFISVNCTAAAYFTFQMLSIDSTYFMTKYGIERNARVSKID